MWIKTAYEPGWIHGRTKRASGCCYHVHASDLGGESQGLGTCWIGAFSNDEIKKLLEVPEGYEVVAATPLGYPSEDVFTEPRNGKGLDEIVSLNKF